MGEDTAAGGWETAAQRFIAKHGPDVAMVMQGKTKPMKERASSRIGIKWEQDHPELVERYGNVIGFFAPEPDHDEPEDYNAYMRLIRSGALQPLTSEQQVRLSNDRIASNMYDQAKAMLGDTIDAHERPWLREISEALRREYPGYGDTFGVPDAANLDTRIDEVERAANDPALAASDTAKGIKLYMQGRAMVKEILARNDLVSLKSASAAPQAQWLRDLGETIVREHPGFDRVWNDVFEWELAQPADESSAPIGA